jgi:LAO/AO transport system ATPase
MTVMPEMLKIRKRLGIEHIPIVLGGIVPTDDHPQLREMGIAAVFNPGSAVDEIVGTMKRLAVESPPIRLPEAKEGFTKHHVPSLARLITAVQRGEGLDGWTAPSGSARIVGVTGAPGVGKSSCIAKLGRKLRDRDKEVAVVAIDPSSPISGGAMLGDRLRMMVGEPDDGFFIRSLSSGNQPGGLAPQCREIVSILNGFGFDYVLVETVGAGQGDVAVRELADHVALVLMPEAGDTVQFSKAGIMEIAHSFVINKCDLPGADATEAELLSTVGSDRPIWKVSSVRNEGFDEVADWIVRR